MPGITGAGPETVTPKPKGSTREFNTTAVTTTNTYATLVELIPTDKKDFDLAYFSAGCDEDIWIRLKWGSDVITPDIPVMAKTFPQFWVPSEYKKVTGDGTTKFTLEVKYMSAAGSAFGEIVGEET